MGNDFLILIKSIFATAIIVISIFLIILCIKFITIYSIQNYLPQDINVNKEIPQKYIILECREKK